MAEKEEQKKEGGKEGAAEAPAADAATSAGKKKKLLLIVGFVVLIPIRFLVNLLHLFTATSDLQQRMLLFLMHSSIL
jgi:hypothetical protein